MAVTAQIAVNTVPGSNDNVPLDALVTLSNVNDTGVTTWEWAIVSQPTEGLGPAAALSSTSTATVTFTPNREGSYLIRLVVNKNQVDEASNLAIVAVRELETGNRVPAIMETTENSDTTGWAGTAINDILRRVTRLTDGGTFVCIADVPLTPGDVVHMSGMTTIASGLPGSRQIPSVNKALATAQANVDGPLGVMIGNRDGQQLAVSAGAYCRVMVIGGLAEYPLESGGLAGDPVYVSNTGTLSRLPGTYIRQIGDIAKVVVDGQYDLSIAAAASSLPRGNAGGDLSGEFPSPTVAKLNGATAPASYAAGNLLYATGTSALGALATGTSSQVLRGGTTPSWGTAPAGSTPYSAIIGVTAETLVSTYTKSDTAGTVVTSVVITADKGVVNFAVLPQILGSTFSCTLFSAANNHQAKVTFAYGVSTPALGTFFTQSIEHTAPFSSGTNQVVGSVPFSPMFFIAPSAATYTIALTAALGTAGDVLTMNNFRLVAWQG